MKSAFLLHDGRLSNKDIIRLDLPHACFAFLSACQTAKGDRNAPDQAMHLAASMLFCGFRSVVGTMWHVKYALSILPMLTSTLSMYRSLCDAGGHETSRLRLGAIHTAADFQSYDANRLISARVGACLQDDMRSICQ
jgi:hypothetical protein